MQLGRGSSWPTLASGLLSAVLVTGCASGPEAGTGANRPAPSAAVASPAGGATPDGPTPGGATPGTPTATLSIHVPKALQQPRTRGPVLGADVSWPQCPKGMGIPQKRSKGLPMPDASARFVILGLTNGPGFTPNPCLADQVTWVRERHLLAAAYSVLSYPDAATLTRLGGSGPFDSGTRTGRLGNLGYQQAAFNVTNLRTVGLGTPIIWIDVEPVPDFAWSDDRAANAAVVRGAARGYRESGFQVGTYSTQALWQGVVGDLRLGLPEWRAAGQTSQAEALRRCGTQRMFQGGVAVLSQWVEDGRDRNITCPGTAVHLEAWFHRY